MSQRNQRPREALSGKPTLKMALAITALSLLLLLLDALLSFWGQGWWITVGGVLGMIGICGLAQALVIALFTGRR